MIDPAIYSYYAAYNIATVTKKMEADICDFLPDLV